MNGVGLVGGLRQLQGGPGGARAQQDQSQHDARGDRGRADEEGHVVSADQRR